MSRERRKPVEKKRVLVNIPFVFEIGDVGLCTHKPLLTIEDCADEVRESIRLNDLDANNMLLNASFIK